MNNLAKQLNSLTILQTDVQLNKHAKCIDAVNVYGGGGVVHLAALWQFV